MSQKDLLSITDLSPERIWHLIRLAQKLKGRGHPTLLSGKSLALIFEKPSLRTRVSFEVAIYQLGGHTVYLSQQNIGLGEREPIRDVARVLSRYVDGIVARTHQHQALVELARHASVPVINGLSDQEHPCQALADLLTIYERKGRLSGLTLAFIGDGNNVAQSLLLACSLMGLHFRMAVPQGYEPAEAVLHWARDHAAANGATITLVREPATAAQGADILYTDVWTSMGQEAERKARSRAFGGYQINAQLRELAQPDALVLHDLPAHRGEEITEETFEAAAATIFHQAENRLPMSKAILAEFLGTGSMAQGG